MTNTETISAVRNLPEFSQRVYLAILDGLYAEPGFSDLEGFEVAKAIDSTPEAVGGAMKRLVEADLIWVEEPCSHLDGAPRFIHAEAHDDDIHEEVAAALRA